ncbi:heme ABC exporter ATP-binding protein CcmA [Dermatophilus congolensis]|nr:heme ABC exporter ATP-binding protein CcmA [Dermatophilus congolensis]MBO3130274.1 heme ABC exporter ATP-binding protein CcmA [Dermatophilus congolensis]MBO3131096.1 heme ABC exporter ATP-binding protein CcmA [Dermatophilus congolensis]MBO3134745.1 heme ABC exporter ATP-binding protein CcmA [Dermatophilus congolensis]MBO3136980.1 heme ABC exporter ATP-binding protein CcmA [Dermatophilus congolensis]MBO3139226.1 heme ABC exporter ATP-binding protein CcmA [Dermatophilus congolensis]
MTASYPRLMVRQLSKSFDGRAVFSGVDLDVHEGEIVSIFGPNGVGKTTLLRCLMGAEEPDSGDVFLDGEPMHETDPQVRRRVAAILDDMAFFSDVTVWEHLDLLARAHGSDETDIVDTALRTLGLADVADQIPDTLSSGQRRRLGLATTLVRPFDLLILDEPEQRLDTAGRIWLGAHLNKLAKEGCSVLMSTHSSELAAAISARRIHLRHL